jgi:hypothetical protein
MTIHAPAPSGALHVQPALTVHSTPKPGNALHAPGAAVGVLHATTALHSQVAPPVGSLHSQLGAFHLEAPVGGQGIQSQVAQAIWSQNTSSPALPDVSACIAVSILA